MAKHTRCTLATGKRWSRSCSELLSPWRYDRKHASSQHIYLQYRWGCLSCMLCTRTHTHARARSRAEGVVFAVGHRLLHGALLTVTLIIRTATQDVPAPLPSLPNDP